MTTATAEVVYCDCHGTQTMAKIRGDKLIVRIRAWGEYHTLALPLDKIPELRVDSQK